MTKIAGLSVVLPCLDEADNVEQAILEAQRAAELAAQDHEIIVVDDGSADATATIVAGLVGRDSRIRLVMHSVNRGYGAALRSGIGAARMPWILLTDSDLQFDLAEIAEFLPHARASDLVVGWRVARSDPFSRRMNAAAWNWLVRRTFSIPVHDVDCAFKLVRRETVAGLDLSSDGAMISTELLVKALNRGARLTELGVRHRPRVAGEQSGADPRVVLRAFMELGRLRRSMRRPSGTVTA